uniref:Putative ribonuclease H-like domain-containing protein n=1 Tax=Tanacetum cinerariifolium TaxID=118510 RepID=A0A6L2MBM7_TANCI|nr:putative ribonuclease H-like domain-containing protein [Tanacetum cinerariifolium]
MAKQAKLATSRNKVSGQKAHRPVWNNVQRVNHKNKFVPTALLTKTSKFLVNAARPNNSSQAASTSTASKVNTARPFVNEPRPKRCFYKSHSLNKRPFHNKTAQRTTFSYHKVNTVNTSLSDVKGNRDTDVKASAGCNWRNKRKPWNKVSTTTDDPHRALKDKGIVDSGYSRYMTWNKAHLADYQDFKSGSVAFGGSNGRITGKGKIKAGRLDFEDVYYVEELMHYNLFSMSQMCDKKNKVLFTDTDCLVLSPDFKLPDENQALLKIPRQHNMYSFNLKNIDPSGDLACLFTKALIDESNKWHRRLGHVNFKNLNKLMKRNLVRGLPSNIFENDHTYVACQKGKQHKASCKAKTASFVNQPLQILHMDLFEPTSVRSINHKTYCLVITDGFSRFSWVYFLKSKDETTPILKDFIRQSGNRFNHNVKTIRSDNGTEFKNNYLIEFCGLKGIKKEYSNARTSQQNGVAERKHITLIEAARTMLADSFYLLHFGQSDYLKNSMNYEPVSLKNQANKFAGPSEANNSVGTQANDDQGANPGEIVLDEEHFVLPIRSAYSTTFKSSGDKLKKTTNFKTPRKEPTHENQNANTNSTNLLNTVSEPVSVVGPSRVLNDSEPSYPDEHSMPHLEDIYASLSEGIFTNSYYDDEGVVTDFNNLETSVNVSPTPITRIHTTHPKTQILRDPMSVVQIRSKVKKNTKAHALVSYIQKQQRNNYKDFQHCLFACFLSQIEPKKISQALEDDSWIDAMQEELLQIHKVWIRADLPFGKKAIGTKWVYRNKKDKKEVVVRNKARLVAQRHRQEEGIDYDEVFTPVARIKAIWIFLAFASYMDFIDYQIDVKSAFLYGTVDEEVYVTQPPGSVDPKFPNKVYKVVKALYGLHQAPRACVKTTTTPIETQKPLIKDEQAVDVDVHLYRSMIGSLMYLTTSRPEIMFANPVFHSKTKRIEIQHHFIRDAYEKKLIQVLKIHTNDNVADLLTKVFDVSSKELASPKQTALGKDESNPFLVDSLLKTIWLSMHHVIEMKHWLFQSKQLLYQFDENDGIRVTAGDLKLLLLCILLLLNKVVITEYIICKDLRLDDADGVECLPTEEIFAELARMGYEKPPPKLTFYKDMVRNVDSPSKFLMYLRFLQVLITNQVDDLSSYTTKYTSPALTQKVFANIRRIEEEDEEDEVPAAPTPPSPTHKPTPPSHEPITSPPQAQSITPPPSPPQA